MVLSPPHKEPKQLPVHRRQIYDRSTYSAEQGANGDRRPKRFRRRQSEDTRKAQTSLRCTLRASTAPASCRVRAPCSQDARMPRHRRPAQPGGRARPRRRRGAERRHLPRARSGLPAPLPAGGGTATASWATEAPSLPASPKRPDFTGIRGSLAADGAN